MKLTSAFMCFVNYMPPPALQLADRYSLGLSVHLWVRGSVGLFLKVVPCWSLHCSTTFFVKIKHEEVPKSFFLP